MQEIFYKTLEDYMLCNNIKIANEIPFDKRKISCINERDVENQISYLKQFHTIMKKSDEYILQRIGNQTGKLAEGLKMDLNKVKKVIEDINIKGATNNFERLLISESGKLVELGEKSIQNIYLNGYIDCIVRSMDNGEICIGNSYFNNLTHKDGSLIIKSTKKISYNIIEMDGFYLLNKLKRKDIKLNWERLICFLCKFEELETNSEEIIRWFMNFPYDFIKCCISYKNGKKKWDEKKYEGKLETAIEHSLNII